MELDKKDTANNLFIATAVLLILGAFLSWASVSAGEFGSLSVSGFDGSDGKLTVLAGGFMGFLAYRRMNQMPIPQWMWIVGWIAAGLSLLLGVYNWFQIDDKVGGELIGIDVSAGIGLYMTIVGGALGLFAMYTAKKAAGGDDPFQTPDPPASES